MTTEREYYKVNLKGWQAKHLGPAPADELLKVAHAFGRPGKQSLALAMAMRPEGVTAGQIIQACGAPQNNHRRAVIEKGWFRREPASATPEGHTVYKITLSKKGEQRLATLTARAELEAAKAGEAPVKAGKAKGKAKRKAATKAAAAETPASEPAPVTEPVANEVADQPQG